MSEKVKSDSIKISDMKEKNRILINELNGIEEK